MELRNISHQSHHNHCNMETELTTHMLVMIWHKHTALTVILKYSTYIITCSTCYLITITRNRVMALCIYHTILFIVILECTFSTYKAVKQCTVLIKQQPHSFSVYHISWLHHFSLVLNLILCHFIRSCTCLQPMSLWYRLYHIAQV